MDHQEANNGKQLERYLLGEMAEAERGAFEEHYFSCAVCAEEVVSAAKFLDNARRPLLQLPAEAKAPVEEPAKVLRWWERWLAPIPKPALAGLCAGLMGVVVWQGLPAAAPAEVTGSYFVTATRASSGAPRRIPVQRDQKRFALLFNHTDASVNRFTFLLEDADGQVVQQFGGQAPRDTNDIQVMVPVAGLKPGRYLMRVENADTHSDIAALPFELAIVP